jgi:PAS domain S-box-containing protein
LEERSDELIRRERAELNEFELRKAKFSVEHTSNAVFWIRSDGLFMYVNQQASLSLGYSKDELYGMTLADIDPRRSTATWQEHWAGLQKTKTLVVETRHRRKDGTYFDCEIAENYMDVEGNEFIAATVRDTTSINKAKSDLLKANSELVATLRIAEESERRFRTLADSASPLCWTTELDSSCSWLNKRWLDYSGRSLEDQVGAGWIETVHPDDREKTKESYMSAFERREPFVLPYRLRRHDGVYRWHTADAAPRFDENGEFVGYVGISFDDHDAKEARQSLIASERALKTANDMLQATFNLLGTSDGVWDWKVGSQEATFAPGFRKILGFEGEDLLAFPNTLEAFESRIHPDDHEMFWESVNDSFKNQAAFVFEFRVRCLDESYCWVRSRANASYDDEGNASRLVGSMQDISAQKDVELERDRFFNTAADLYAVVDLQSMKWLKLSPTWSATFGVSLEEMLDTLVPNMSPADERPSIEKHVKKLLNHEPVRGWVNRMIHGDGSIRYIEWNIDPPLPGESVVYGTGRDVTVLREYMERIEENAEELASINQQLSRSNRDLSQFAYVASHDLQEPLRAIGGFLQLLELKYGDQLNDTAKGYINNSVGGVARMNRLINDLLHFSRVTNDEPDLLDVDLNKCVSVACEKLFHPIQLEKAVLEIEDLPVIQGFEPLLVQLFQNLIGNAIKYRSEATPVVKVACESDEGGVRIFVRDNGIGIDTKYQQQVFSLFKRLHHREDYVGTGIGLAVCERVAERHGGSISVSSNESGGSCFTVWIPKHIEVEV